MLAAGLYSEQSWGEQNSTTGEMLYLKPNHEIRYKGFSMNFYIPLGACWVIFCLLEEEKQDEIEQNMEAKQLNVIVIKASLCLPAWHSVADVAPFRNASLKPLTLVISPIFFISNTNSLQVLWPSTPRPPVSQGAIRWMLGYLRGFLADRNIF